MIGFLKKVKNKPQTNKENKKKEISYINNEWIEDDFEEGQLSLDVYETPKEIVVRSTIAGVDAKNLDIYINNDMLTIRGHRKEEEKIKNKKYLYQECYWGSFSRSIILPVEVKIEKIEAQLENGILTIILPKAKENKKTNIKVKEK